MTASTEATATAGTGRRSWLAVLALCRVSNLPTVWMNVLAAVVLAASAAPAAIDGAGLVAAGVLLAVAMSASYCGGMALNDVWDAAHDARHQPFRPIPSGGISLRRARAVAAGLLGLGWGLLLAAPHPSAVVPGAVLLAAIVVYDRFHKAYGATVVVMAACRLLVFVTGAWAVVGEVPPLVWVAGAAQLVYTLVVTLVARAEGLRGHPFPIPALVPRLLAGMALVDGLILALAVSPRWVVPAVGAAVLTRLGQRTLVRGD